MFTQGCWCIICIFICAKFNIKRLNLLNPQAPIHVPYVYSQPLIKPRQPKYVIFVYMYPQVHCTCTYICMCTQQEWYLLYTLYAYACTCTMYTSTSFHKFMILYCIHDLDIYSDKNGKIETPAERIWSTDAISPALTGTYMCIHEIQPIL